MSPDVVWGLLFLVGGAYEAYGIFNKAEGDTLSERTRAWFRTHKKPGRALFTAAWAAFSVWFWVHIVLQIV